MNLFKKSLPQYTGKKPDFIIAGFSKCGTTALARNLDKHPDIKIGRLHDGKGELMFFNDKKRWEKGYKWYFNHFNAACAGDKTPSYVYTSECMERIANILPEIKLIFCVRNPVDRLISWYNHKIIRDKKLSPETFPFSSYRSFYMGHMYDPLLTGCYATVIRENVIPFLSLNCCHFVVQEHMILNPEHEVQRILKFLGVSKHSIDCSHHNVSRKRVLIDNELRSEIVEFYKKHNEEFSALTGISLTHWNQ